MDQGGPEAELVAGRYRILRELARGGVGAVYEAFDESTGQRVALKRLLPDSAQKPRLAMLFESEYDTLARLRHPRIVEVFDYGIDKRGPYFTMELLDGQDLGDLEPITYRDACRYLRDVASSLALLHTRRRLHRDLSPRNVRLTSNGRCRLLDFGTMASFGVAEDIVGTPPMVPPEALRGAALDHRADIYSLGALAYRLLTSRYAYRARQLEDLPELWRSPPVRLRELSPEVPIELDELVMAMLSLDPTYRPTSTYEVIDRLTAIGELPPDEDSGSAAQGYLVGSRLIGRTRPIESVQRRLARAHRERGSTIIVEGNPGVGKSRLLDEVALQAQLSGALTVRVDARAHRGDYAVVNALVKAIVKAAPHDAQEAAEPYVHTLGQVFDVFSPEPGTPPVQHAPDARMPLHTAFLRWLFDLSEDRTLVVLVDDLPRIDESSASLLSMLAQQTKQRRILFVAARRLADKAPALTALEAIVSQARRLRIHRLRREHTLSVLESLFGRVPNVELFGNWIHDVTTGSPMQIMELAHHLVHENVARFVDGLWVLPPTIPTDELPRNLSATLSARAAALNPEERALAEALCVRRGALSLPLCLKLSGSSDARALFRTTDELVAKGVLVSGPNGYHFGQDALREVLQRELPTERARTLHLRLGEALLELGAQRPEDVIEAGFNLLLGGAEERGADLLAKTAPKLTRRGSVTSAALPALEAALELYEKWGRPPQDCLRLRTVMIGSMDRRIVAQYGDNTLDALAHYAGAHDAARLRHWLSPRLAFVVAYGVANLRHWFTRRTRRGPRPHDAIIALYRAAFAVMSVRTSVLDVAGTQRLLHQTEAIEASSAVGPIVAETFRTLVLALRGQISSALATGRHAFELLNAAPNLERVASAAAQGGIRAGIQVALGMVEAQYALRSHLALDIIEELTRLSKQAAFVEPNNLEYPHSGGITAPEFGLMIEQLRVAYHLARGERLLAEEHHNELLLHSVQTGLQHQFDIWHNLLECNMSARALDAASLRRCVEIFMHYVGDYPQLAPHLEIARAHLAHCLGKPQEALAGYEKWVARLKPGQIAGWEGLYLGYADALLAAGAATRARQWIAQLSHDPALAGAPLSSCRITLEALWAWAEAEDHQLAAATERIDRLLRELADADQPLVMGYVHEIAARIAQRRDDSEMRGQQLARVKHWYGLTRNAALLMRAQRIAEDIVPAGVQALSEPDLKVVTRVTTRREVTNLDSLFDTSADRNEIARHALHVVVERAGGVRGYLYLIDRDGLQLCAATRGEPEHDFEAAIIELLSRPHEDDRTTDSAHAAPVMLQPEIAAETTEHCGLYLLRDPQRGSSVGAVLVVSSADELRSIASDLLQTIATRITAAHSDDTQLF